MSILYHRQQALARLIPLYQPVQALNKLGHSPLIFTQPPPTNRPDGWSEALPLEKYQTQLTITILALVICTIMYKLGKCLIVRYCCTPKSLRNTEPRLILKLSIKSHTTVIPLLTFRAEYNAMEIIHVPTLCSIISTSSVNSINLTWSGVLKTIINGTKRDYELPETVKVSILTKHEIGKINPIRPDHRLVICHSNNAFRLFPSEGERPPIYTPQPGTSCSADVMTVAQAPPPPNELSIDMPMLGPLHTETPIVHEESLPARSYSSLLTALHRMIENHEQN